MLRTQPLQQEEEGGSQTNHSRRWVVNQNALRIREEDDSSGENIITDGVDACVRALE